MMKYPCNVIKDLLPSYIDELCSEESRGIVKAHLSDCPECRQYYNNMKSELAGENKNKINVTPINEKELIQKVNRKYRNQAIRNFLVGVVACALIVCLIFALFTPNRTLKASDYSVSYKIFDMNEYIVADDPHDIVMNNENYLFLSDEFDMDKLDDTCCVCIYGRYIIVDTDILDTNPYCTVVNIEANEPISKCVVNTEEIDGKTLIVTEVGTPIIGGGTEAQRSEEAFLFTYVDGIK